MKQKKKLLLTACVGGALSVIWLAVSPVFKRTSDVSYKTGKWRRRQKGEAGSMDRGRTIFHRSDRAGTAENRSGDC